MPPAKKKKKDLQAGFPDKARAAIANAEAALKSGRSAKGGQMGIKERAGHERAISAANRVLTRMGQGSGGKKKGKTQSKGFMAGVKALVGLTGKEKKNLDRIAKQTGK